MDAPADTPSARLIAASQAASEVRDAQGRRLAIRRMGALDRLRLFKAAGAQLAANPAWLGMAAVACSVVAIDDVPVPAPASEPHVEALVARLGEAGIAAAAAALAAIAVPVADAKKLIRHPDLVDSLFLVRNGVPFDVAFSLPPDERTAWVVALGLLDGRHFDFATQRWEG